MAADSGSGSGIPGVTGTGDTSGSGSKSDSASGAGSVSGAAAAPASVALPSFDDLAGDVAALKGEIVSLSADRDKLRADLDTARAEIDGLKSGTGTVSASGTGDTSARLDRIEHVLRPPFDREFAEYDEAARVAAAAKTETGSV